MIVALDFWSKWFILIRPSIFSRTKTILTQYNTYYSVNGLSSDMERYFMTVVLFDELSSRLIPLVPPPYSLPPAPFYPDDYHYPVRFIPS